MGARWWRFSGSSVPAGAAGPFARSLSLALLSVFAQGCASTQPEPVDPALVERTEARLLAPYAEERAVLCDRLELVLSANFVDQLTLPTALPAVQAETRRELPDGGSIREFTTSGAATLEFFVAATRFVVSGQGRARVEVLGGRSAYRLSAKAAGHVVVVTATGHGPEVAELAIDDGEQRVR
ncbi:MAG: hypothetical protein IPM29_10935 [Planctomycetes bacterium]|nr:hypothetical protein [Planctomycetota bacterium]